MPDIRFIHLHGAHLVLSVLHRLIAELFIGLAPYLVEPKLPGPSFVFTPDLLYPLLQDKLHEPGQFSQPNCVVYQL